MLTLYADKKSITKGSNFIYMVDLAFDKEVYNLTIDDKDKQYMLEIDNASYEGNGYITTLFGRTEIQNLSTGCKALIMLNHMGELHSPIINIGECGKNVLDKIFDMDSINIYLEFCLIPDKYNREKVINVVVSGKCREMELREVFNKVWRNKA